MADQIDLSGVSAIVTGGGRGLGRVMTLSLLGAGASVTAAMHIEDDVGPLKEAATEIRAKARRRPGDTMLRMTSTPR